MNPWIKSALVAPFVPGMPFVLHTEWEQRNDGWPRAFPWIMAALFGMSGCAIFICGVAHYFSPPWYVLVAAFPLLNVVGSFAQPVGVLWLATSAGGYLLKRARRLFA